MNVDVSLCGLSGPWRFRGSAGLESWLRGSPWLNLGGLAIVLVPDRAFVPILASAVRHEVWAVDEGRSPRIRFVDLTEEDVRLGLGDSLFRWLELGPVTPSYRRLDRLATACAFGATVVVAPAESQSVVDEAALLCDSVGKIRPGANLTMLLASRLLDGATAECFDFRVGFPSMSLFEHLFDHDSVLWSSYAHFRAAWEAAGNPQRAQAIDADLRSRGATPDDDRLEALFNDIAEISYAAVSDDDRAALRKRVAGLGRREPRVATDARNRDLEAAGLLARLPGSSRLQPVPWVCRALLRGQLDELTPFRPLLRNTLVCAPLARELLGRCLELEAAVISALHASRSLPAPRDEWVWRYEAFRGGSSASAARYYPRDSPCAPQCAHDLASMGQILEDFFQGDRMPECLRDLTLLRNSLAHGHYVTWGMVKEFRRISQQLA